MRRSILLPLAALAACASPTDLPRDSVTGQATAHSPTFFALPTNDAIWSAAYGVSANGWVAGEVDVSDFDWHAARWRLGTAPDGTPTATLEDLGSLNGRVTFAFDVNTSGVVVGGSAEAAFGFGPGPDEAFVYRDGVMQALPTLGGPGGFARRINERGWITGYSDAADGTIRPVIWRPADDGSYRIIDLGSLGGTYGWGNTITDDGVVVGLSEQADGSVTAWRRTARGQRQLLPGLTDGGLNYAVDISPRGLIVGNGTDAAGSNHATIWRNGTVEDIHLLFPGFGFSFATAISAPGEIAVDAFDEIFFMPRAFVVSRDQVIDLGQLSGGALSDAYDISDHGVVAGDADVGGVTTAAVWFLRGGGPAVRAQPAAPAVTPMRAELAQVKAKVIRRLLAGGGPAGPR